MKVKKIILVILILGIVGAIIGYKTYNKPHLNIVATKADFNVSANKIIEDFSTDETTANSKYLEKIIAIKGIISDIKIEKEKGIITLKTNDDFASILCHLSEEATNKMSDLKVGESITIKGICTGYLMDVILVKSEF
ncbi:OB-fold putative lipoprotein [Polaribacter vadi]|uniref:OB-fold putative lipoprotein n=1 Tax=Polaribacter TaxID=52959 RepID=UPI001C092A19|nr:MULTISPECIES: OB-fold putative lipoprotein [Polaribacter]MBU3012110.1 OB-fold putative lipoprotein [Polaribacter vadi]MDO6741926.1 OB-fold putative lipoprotein [Polaribacter sp. 1_MG-2023]